MNSIKYIKPGCGCLLEIPTVFGSQLTEYERLCRIEQKVNEMIYFINNNLETLLREQLNLLFISSMYDEETETLIIVLEMRDENG